MSLMTGDMHEARARKAVAYLAHPVSAPTRDGIEENLANCRLWLRWLVEHTEWAVSCPWMPYVQTLDESTHRDRGIADDLAMLERHDLIVLVGGRVSSGMAGERAHAKIHGLVQCDLSRFTTPPHAPSIAHVDAIMTVRRASAEIAKRGDIERTRRG